MNQQDLAEKGRKPDYNLAFLDKETDRKGNIGVAWKNVDGSISIVLNPLVAVEENPNMLLTLFERKEWSPPKAKKKETPSIKSDHLSPPIPADDDVPF